MRSSSPTYKLQGRCVATTTSGGRVVPSASDLKCVYQRGLGPWLNTVWEVEGDWLVNMEGLMELKQM